MVPNSNDTRTGVTTETPVTTHPGAVVMLGHVALARLHDPGAPILCDPGDVFTAGDRDHLDARCPWCDSVQSVQADHWSVMITTGHADGCPWFRGVLADAVRRDGEGIAEFAARLAEGDAA